MRLKNKVAIVTGGGAGIGLGAHSVSLSLSRSGVIRASIYTGEPPFVLLCGGSKARYPRHPGARE